MVHGSIVPLLIALLAPVERTPAADAPSEVTALDEAAPDEAAPTDAAPDEAAPDEAAPAAEPPPASTPEAVVSPFGVPPPTAAAIPPPPPAPTPIPPPPPRPIRWRVDVGLGLGSTVVLKDRGYLAFSSDRNLLALDVSTILDFRLAKGRFFVGGGVGYQLARTGGSPYDVVSLYNTATLHEPRVLGRASFMVIEGIDAFARAGVGPSIIDLYMDSFDDADGYLYATQRAVLPRVDGQTGLSLYLPKQWLRRKQAARFTAGLELSLGYTWRGTMDVRPELQRGGDPLRITTPRWGELSLHGLAWGVGLFVRVM